MVGEVVEYQIIHGQWYMFTIRHMQLNFLSMQGGRKPYIIAHNYGIDLFKRLDFNTPYSIAKCIEYTN